ncbi:hypothetical protein CASFOL_028662 [Castilleja foliolosa]|uniref:Uncharacterized protein n=1 Tax=Castilleja foliolosa TaxID=1961234 RepID=A0ABD3CCL9_9LAMI
MASIRPATRYTNNSSTRSDPSSSAEFSASRALARKNDAPNINFTSMVKRCWSLNLS